MAADTTQISSFWTSHGDYWLAFALTILGVVLSWIGFYYSKKASKEAELAKNAAKQAGIVVKTQEIMMELERISNECLYEEDIKFSEATNRLNEISSRVYGIIGIYKADAEIKEQSQIIQDNFAAVKTALEGANPSIPTSAINDPAIDEKFKVNYVFNITSPHFTSLINSLSTLRGILNSRLINNNQDNGQ